ncbi:MAG: hypothetical protein QJR06_11085 [Alicyclobacillaceae bacterium]|nr:hypothetical protein [Alicyclobacillaceae bacterium]
MEHQFFARLREEWDRVRLERASVAEKAGMGPLYLVGESDPRDPRVLVLLKIPAGFRGGGEYTSARYSTEPCVLRNRKMAPWDLDGRFCIRCGTFIAAGSFHPDAGEQKEYLPLEQEEKVRVLAEGRVENGPGRTVTGWPEMLVVMEPGAAIRYYRTGEMDYKLDNELFVRWDGKELAVGGRYKVFPSTGEEPVGRRI